MFRTAIVHLRRQWMGALALVLVLGTGTAYAANTVRSVDIVDGQVRTADLATGAVRSADIANGQVKSIDVLNDTLTGTDIKEDTLVAGGDLTGTLANAQVAESGLVAGGDLSGTVDALAIANNSIGFPEPAISSNDEIVDGSIDSEDVLNNGLTGGDIADTGSIGDAEIGDVVRTITIPANALVGAALAEPAGTSPDIGIIGNSTALLFDQTTLEAIRIPIRIPSDRVVGSDLDVSILWAATGGVGTSVTWHFSYAPVTPGADAVNVALTDGNQGSVNVTAANRLLSQPFASPDIAGASVGNGDLLLLRMFRDASNSMGGLDDLAQDAALLQIEVAYSAVR